MVCQGTAHSLQPMPSPAIKLAVLLSGGGRTLQSFIDQIAAGRLNAQVALVIGSREGLGGIDRAAAAGLSRHVVDRRNFRDAASFSQRIFSLCDNAGADLICLAGWLCLLEIPARYVGRIMNIHPALLPSF